MEYFINGDLWTKLEKMVVFGHKRPKFYTAEII
jgi:hypothetical protein